MLGSSPQRSGALLTVAAPPRPAASQTADLGLPSAAIAVAVKSGLPDRSTGAPDGSAAVSGARSGRVGTAQPKPRTMDTIFSPHSVGFWVTNTPAAVSASIFAWAVPCEPEMMAPAWPILRPGGAVTPAT
jgi:hypothetical protein